MVDRLRETQDRTKGFPRFGGTGEQKEVVEGDFANSDFDVCSEHE
jgi:hypothetical protein